MATQWTRDCLPAEAPDISCVRCRSDTRALLLIGIVLATCGAADRIRIAPNTRVPPEYQRTPQLPPNGEPEPVRYKKAYEAFWWNCAVVRARDLRARCPLACSGTPAATAGCAQGSDDADQAIDDAISQHGEREVIRYLRSLTKRPEAREKLKAYFPEPLAYSPPR